nr:hypothetical protein [Angustibacter aerolatus]
MDFRRILRGPVIWVALILVIVFTALRLGNLGDSLPARRHLARADAAAAAQGAERDPRRGRPAHRRRAEEG